jgi:peptide/nickel transport system substrate-binding protein
VFSVERALSANSQMKTAVQGVTSAKKIDNLTVDLILKDPNPALISHLFLFRIVNKAWAIKNNSKDPQNYKDKEDTFASRNTNGTGPFILKERQPDVKIVLTEHKQWWNRNSPEKGNVTDAIILPIKSNSTRVAGLLSGDVDFVLDAPQQDIARLRNTGFNGNWRHRGAGAVHWL